MCKRLLNFLALVFLLSSSTILAQSKTISGTITDSSGLPLPGANIILEGTRTGTSSDFDGYYTLDIPNDGILVYSMLGFENQSISTVGKTTIDLILIESTETLDEIVVTALGIKKAKKALSYSVQEVASEDLTRASNGNINTSLQGKVAGVNITTSGGVTGNARFEIRGSSSLSGNDQVLWVIDGVPFSAGDTSDPQGLFGGVSNGGGLLDINPDNIETISVLKGGQAAALYGSRGANGVVLITTKSGKGSKGLGISYTTSTTFSTAAYFLDLQTEYGQGNEGVYDPRSRFSWGPRFDGVVRPAWTGEDLPYVGEDNLIKDFTRTAVSTRHAIAFSNGNDKGNFRASILSDKNEGVFKDNQLKKLDFSLKADYDISPWLNVDTKISYIRNRGQQRPEIGVYSFVTQLSIAPANIRTEDLAPGFFLTSDGRHVEYLFGPNINDLTANPNANSRNPYFVQEQFVNNDERNRMFGYLAGNIKINKNLSLKLKYGLDFYRYQTIAGFRFADNLDPNGRPSISTSEKFFKEDNLEFLLRYNKDFGEDFSFGLSVGGNNMRNSFTTLSSTSGQLTSEADFFLNAGTDKNTSQEFRSREIQSVYGFMDMSYKDYLFLTVTARNDWSSALPVTDNSYFYPSVGLSGLISEMVDMPDWFTYLKLRGSWAQLGKDTNPFQTKPVFTFFPDSSFGQLSSDTPDRLVNANLKPEISTTSEVGLEVRLFGSRFTLDATYYEERTTNQIIEVPIGQVSGFTSRVDNVGSISNKGIEFIATIVPIKTNDFDLGLTFNFASNASILEELTTPEDNDEFFRFLNAGVDIRATEGEKMGDILGFAYERDANGTIIVDTDGLPVGTAEFVKLGNVQADFTGSIGLNANYKDFSLSALFGVQQGGDIYSATEARATISGNALKTLSLGREPFFVDGRLADGSPNLQITSPQRYWARVAGISEEFIYDASFMKLSEISLGYNIPVSAIEKLGKFSNARISIIGRNLFYLYRDTPGTVPDAAIYNTTFGAQGFDFSPTPATRSYGVSLNLNF